MSNRHVSPGSDGTSRRWLWALAAAAMAVGVVVLVVITGRPGADDRTTADRPGAAPASTPYADSPPSASATVTAPPSSTEPSSSNALSSIQPSSSASPSRVSTPDGRPAGTTPQGMWWGVDSTEAISRHTLRNVAGWYRGARPQFWGRYLRGDYGVTTKELAFARRHGIYVFVIVGDRNCSQCGGVDVCGNDRTSAQARHDADNAIDRARELRLPTGTTLFKDIEQVSSCRGEPTSDYLLSWYRSVRPSGYRTGFYGNVHKQHYDFPVAYCAAAAADTRFAAEVLLDMNQPEPRLGAPRGSTAPDNAPKYKPKSPSCADPSRTVIWQYGESVDRDNLTDIDQARPDVAGLLAPHGGVS